MNIRHNLVSSIDLPDGSKELYLDIEPSQQVYLGYLLEGLEGHCYHTITAYPGYRDTSEPPKKLLKITVVPDFYEDVMKLLRLFKEWI